MIWSRALRVLPSGLYHVHWRIFFLGNQVSTIERSLRLHRLRRSLPLSLVRKSTKVVPIVDLVSSLREEHEKVAFASVRMTVLDLEKIILLPNKHAILVVYRVKIVCNYQTMVDNHIQLSSWLGAAVGNPAYLTKNIKLIIMHAWKYFLAKQVGKKHAKKNRQACLFLIPKRFQKTG